MNPQSNGVHPEVEWQLDAVDLRPVERWLFNLESAGEPAVMAASSHEQSDTYFDTSDWRVAAAGYVLRVRRLGDRREATLKSRSVATAGLQQRLEITEQLGAWEITALPGSDGPVGHRLRALIGSKPLRALFTLDTRRRCFDLSLDGAPAGELTLDETSIPLGTGVEPVRLSRVEVEVDPSHVDRLSPFIDHLIADCHLQSAAMSKFDLALLSHGFNIDTSIDLGSTEITESQTIAEVAFAVLRKHFGRLLSHEPGSRLGDDIEELHDMRVAARRLRAALSLFADFLPLNVQRTRDELRWVASALGEVRDLDVQLEQLASWMTEANEDDRSALSELTTVLQARRETSRARMLEVLDSNRYERFVASFATTVRRGPSRRTGKGREPVLAVAPDLISRRYRRVIKQGDAIKQDSPPETYHELRIQCKRLRYALEFFSPIYEKDARKLIESLVALQDLLGDHQDAYIAIEHLRELSASAELRLPPETVFVMGKIAHRYELEAVDRRRRFPKLYRQLKGKHWNDFERTMKRRRPVAEPEPPAKSTPSSS